MARWALAAMAATLDLGALAPGRITSDPLFRPEPWVWALDMGAMAALSAVMAYIVACLLRRQELTVMRR